MQPRRFISATELVNYTRCHHISTLASLGVRRAELSEDAALFASKGDEHEYRFRQSLENCFDVPSHETPSRRLEITLDAMRKGYDWIYHGYLLNERCEGEIDFLRKVPEPCPAFGGYSYEVCDTKLGRRAKA